MKPAMATRKPTDSEISLKNCTEFCLHKSQQTMMSDTQSNVYDYTEYRLRRYAAIIVDEQQKSVIRNLLVEYVAGLVAVAWNKGKPQYIRVTRAA